MEYDRRRVLGSLFHVVFGRLDGQGEGAVYMLGVIGKVFSGFGIAAYMVCVKADASLWVRRPGKEGLAQGFFTML